MCKKFFVLALTVVMLLSVSFVAKADESSLVTNIVILGGSYLGKDVGISNTTVSTTSGQIELITTSLVLWKPAIGKDDSNPRLEVSLGFDWFSINSDISENEIKVFGILGGNEYNQWNTSPFVGVNTIFAFDDEKKISLIISNKITCFQITKKDDEKKETDYCLSTRMGLSFKSPETKKNLVLQIGLDAFPDSKGKILADTIGKSITITLKI